MRTKNPITYLLIISPFLLVASVYIFKQPAFISIFNLSKDGGLGSAIGGMTAPIIGLISTVLLYLALTKQTEANKDGRLKNESDIIFLLLNQLDQEINSFSTYQTHGNKPDSPVNTNNGTSGISIFCHRCAEKGYEAILKDPHYGFHMFLEAPPIMMMIESYILVEGRIGMIADQSDLKQLFSQKLRAYYDIKLRRPFEVLAKALKRYDVQDQPFPKKIIQFVNSKI
jgi:hypothetical protein